MRVKMILMIVVALFPAMVVIRNADAQQSKESYKKSKVFLDRFWRDESHIKREITYVDYVRDPAQADIYILKTEQSTGGGSEYSLTFLGQANFEGKNDTLSYAAKHDATEDELRKMLISYINLGLVRFLPESQLGDNVRLNIKEVSATESLLHTEDKWNFWVFRINTHTMLEGEESFKEISLGGRISAKRITDRWKIDLSYSPDYSESEYETDDKTYLNIRREQRFKGLIVKSLSGRWSAGVISEIMSDTRFNTKFSAALGPAVEYNVFPYSQSTRRMFTFRIGAWTKHTDYIEETIFDKNSEFLNYATLSVGTEIVERWGDIESTIECNVYFHDPSFNKLDWNTECNFRIAKGLSFDFGGRVSLIHDQLYIAKGDISVDQVLLQRTQLKTNWSYDTWIGFSYFFGSQFDNIVNPRFPGADGRRHGRRR